MFGVCAVSLVANSAPPAVSAGAGEVRAQIVTDGAAVYSKPDFDSPVQDYLGYESKVVITKRPYAGQGGMGLFHRVRYNNKTGYIPDTDVRASGREIQRETAAEKKRNPSNAFKDETSREQRSLYLTRSIGAAIASVAFTEKYSGHNLSSNLLMYGLRLLGPGTLFRGPALDVNIWGSLSKPGYYKNFASASPTGFLLFGDLQLELPLIQAQDTVVSYGLGFMWTYTHFAVPVRGAVTGTSATFDVQELRLGGDIGLGVGHRFGKVQLRADAKYYIEKTSYPGYLVSLLWEY